MSTTRVIGIDPGSFCCGYGIVEKDERKNLRFIDAGVIRLPRKNALPERLRLLYKRLVELLDQFSPTEAAIEKVFFAKSINGALGLGHARGVVLLALATKGIEVKEYSPNEVKKSVVGYGRAEKFQVQKMVRTILTINNHELNSDSADALAIAVCHLNTVRF